MSRQLFGFLSALVFLCLAGCAHDRSIESAANPFACAVEGDHVVVTFNDSPNPEYFGVSSGDDFIYLNYPPAHADFTPYNRDTRVLRLAIPKQQGIEYNNGDPVRVRVFAKPGSYRLLFADNLETEPDSTFSLQCQVIL